MLPVDPFTLSLCALKQKQMKVMPWLVELRPKISSEVIMASKEGGNVTFRTTCSS